MNITNLLIALIILGIIISLINNGYKSIILSLIKNHRKKQSKNLRFLQIKIPKSSGNNEGQSGDNIQSMKQNIEIMNQVYKNFYAIYEDTGKNRRYGNNYITMEMIVEKEIIKFIMAVPEDHVENVEKMISGFYPGGVIDIIQQPKLFEAGKYISGGEFILNKESVYPIKTYESFEADPMDSVLSAYSRVLNDEKLGLQILVSPVHEKEFKKLREHIDDIKEGKNHGFFKKIILGIWGGLSGKTDKDQDEDQKKEHKHDFSQQQLGDLDKKIDDELFEVKIRAIATSPNSHRPEKMINDLTRSFSQYSYIGLNTFKFQKAKHIKRFVKEYMHRIFFTEQGTHKNRKAHKQRMLLSIKELSSMVHFPHSRFNKNPRISRQKYRIIAAPDELPNEGILLGRNTYGGVKKEIRFAHEDRFRHLYIVGQTGTGKSTMLLTQAFEDLKQGNGFCVLDPHGDLCENILERFPKDRIDDLIYFDMANTEYPIAFNPLDGTTTDDERDVVTNDLIEMFVSMYGEEIFGPRIQDYFRNACFLLMEQPDGGTLIDIMRLFTDDAFAESKIRNLKNPVIAAWWNKTYKKMGEREKQEIIPFIQAKFAPFTTGTYIRNIIGQPRSAFNFGKAMQEGKIILCNLSKGLTGEVNSQLIGRMVAMQIKLAALKRAAIPPEERKPYFLYVDEFQNYVSQSFESILSEARKYRLGLTVAHQYIDQLKQKGLGGEIDLSKTIFGNVGSILAFKVGPNDAEFLETNFGPDFTKNDLMSSETFKGAMKLSVNTSQSKPFSISCKVCYGEPKINTPEKVEIIKQISALKRGTKRELADKEIYFRVGV